MIRPNKRMGPSATNIIARVGRSSVINVHATRSARACSLSGVHLTSALGFRQRLTTASPNGLRVLAIN